MRDVQSLEGEIGIDRRDRTLAPADAALDRIDAIVAARLRIEILGERHGHPADAAADVEHAAVFAQAADADEVTEKLRSDRAEISVSDEDVGGSPVAAENDCAGRIRSASEHGLPRSAGPARMAGGEPLRSCCVPFRASIPMAAGRCGSCSADWFAISSLMSSSQRWVCSHELYWLATPRM